MDACKGLDCGMAAVLFGSPALIQEAISQATRSGGFCEVSNVNSPKQLVVSGEKAVLASLPSILKSLKQGRRCKVIPLNVDYPFHSSVLKHAGEEFDLFVRDSLSHHTLEVNNPVVPIISNVDGSIMKRKEDLVERMGKQICSAVQWEEDVRVARSLGMESFVEIGPKPVLAPLVSSIDKAIQVV
ncbi:hypothetical protein WA538_005661 [Blastocystis sp. DL]